MVKEVAFGGFCIFDLSRFSCLVDSGDLLFLKGGISYFHLGLLRVKKRRGHSRESEKHGNTLMLCVSQYSLLCVSQYTKEH